MNPERHPLEDSKFLSGEERYGILITPDAFRDTANSISNVGMQPLTIKPSRLQKTSIREATQTDALTYLGVLPTNESEL